MTNQTINEQQLLLYYYDDGVDPAEKQAITVALQTDTVLAARYQELSSSLAALQDESSTPAPAYLKEQWHDLVSREAQLERQKQQRLERRKPWLGWAAGLATMLVLGIAIGLWLQPEVSVQDPAGPGLVALPPDLPETSGDGGAFSRLVQYYFDGQQSELAGMRDTASEANQLLLLQIIAQNRLIERAAVANNSPELARLVRAFEPVLFRLADPATTPEEAAALQRQLAFELQAVLTKLQQAPSKAATVI